MKLEDLTADTVYCTITEAMLRSACDAVDIEVASVDFGARDREANYSWICFLVDPASEDRGAAHSASSATDHLQLENPNGFTTRAAGDRLALTVYEIELSHEAPMTVRGDNGEPTLISPWTADLAVARAKFNYRVAID
jgi:hypothetical protein